MAFFQKLFGQKDNRRGKISLPDENDELHFSPNLPSNSPGRGSGIEESDFTTTFNPSKSYLEIGTIQIRDSKEWSAGEDSSDDNVSDEEEGKVSIGLPDLDTADNKEAGLAGMSKFRANFGIFTFHKNRWAARVMQFDLLQKQLKIINGKTVNTISFESLHPATPDQNLSQIFHIRYGEGKPNKYRVQTELDRKMILDLTAHIASYYQTKGSSSRENERDFLDSLEKTLSNQVHKRAFILLKNGVKWGTREVELEVFRNKPELAHVSIYLNKDDDHLPIRTISLFSVDFLNTIGDHVINLHASGRVLEFKFRSKASRDEWFSAINNFILASRPNFVLGTPRMNFKDIHLLLEPTSYRGIHLKQCSITFTVKEGNLSKLMKSTSTSTPNPTPPSSSKNTMAPDPRSSLRFSRIGESQYPPLPVHSFDEDSDFFQQERDLEEELPEEGE